MGEKQWEESLGDDASVQNMILKKDMTEKLMEILQDTNGFKFLIIVKFFPGSVIVNGIMYLSRTDFSKDPIDKIKKAVDDNGVQPYKTNKDSTKFPTGRKLFCSFFKKTLEH